MIGRIARRARAHLNYATVVTAISLFLLLAGGAAYAASQLAKNSVGSKQLKANSVTAAKIKKDAITTAKIKKDAVVSAKFKAGSIGGASINLPTTPYSRVLHVAKATGPVTVGSKKPSPVALEGATYTQAAGEDDVYFGTATVSVPAGCEGPNREVYVNLLIDSANPLEPVSGERLSQTKILMPPAGAAAETAALSLGEWRFAPASPTAHTLAMTGKVECEGGTESAVIESAEVDVVGTR